MRLTNILREIEDEEDNIGQNVKIPTNMVLIPINASLQDLEKALNDDSNYEAYSRNVQNVGSAALQSKIESEQTKIFGPTGKSIKDRTPPAKVKKAKELWDAADVEWRKDKAKDIKSRFPEFDITGWEELEFDQLPKEARKYNVFYPIATKAALDNLITSLAGKAEILTWVEEDGLLVFPRKDNKNVPGDETLEKVLRTVMDNAGIEDFIITKKEATDDEESSPEKIEPEKPSIPAYNITSTPDGTTLTVEDAEDLKDDLESKVSELNPKTSEIKIRVIPSQQNPDNAILKISGFKSNKERSAIQQKIQNVINRLFESKLKRIFQVRAGIIK
jgi:hypothetical protein